MKNKLFNVVKSLNPSRNLFDLSHERLLSFNLGKLYPFFYQEVMPSDKFKLSSEIMVRTHPLTNPAFGRINIYTHFFYVPFRMIWKNFESYITGGDDGNFTCNHPVLQISNASKANFKKGMLPDYFGIPPIDQTPTYTSAYNISALPFRAYNLIYNEYYRDENLSMGASWSDSDEVLYSELVDLCIVRNRCWPKDYFTSSITDTQKGGEVMLPVTLNYSDQSTVLKSDGSIPTTGGLQSNTGFLMNDGLTENLRIENLEATGVQVTINDLRKSNKLQEYLERNARSGSRMAEWLLAHWSVKADDLRIHRPKYLSGSKQPLTISEVLSSYEADPTGPTYLGDMAGHGISVGKHAGFSHFFKEYGCVIGIMSALPEAYYRNGIPRQFIKLNKFDYPVPEFANLGEQPIYSGELYSGLETTEADLYKTFGYTPRFAEYKSCLSRVSGDFHDNLANWTMTRDFTTVPPLNGDFVKADCATIENKIFPVQDSGATNKFYAYVYHNLKAVRPLPVFGEPRL